MVVVGYYNDPNFTGSVANGVNLGLRKVTAQAQAVVVVPNPTPTPTGSVKVPPRPEPGRSPSEALTPFATEPVACGVVMAPTAVAVLVVVTVMLAVQV